MKITDLKLPEWRRAFWKKYPEWEKEHIEALLNYISPGDTIIDVGAELGDITALAAQKAGADGEVYAFEPVEKMWPSIRFMFEQNGLKTPHCFVGFAGQEAKNGGEVVSEWPECSEGDPIEDPGFQFLDERYDLPVIAIDDLAIDPDVITIDVEGAELEVLLGAELTLGRAQPYVIVSVHPEFIKQRFNQTREDVLAFMAELGYKAELLATDHEEHWLFT